MISYKAILFVSLILKQIIADSNVSYNLNLHCDINEKWDNSETSISKKYIITLETIQKCKMACKSYYKLEKTQLERTFNPIRFRLLVIGGRSARSIIDHPHIAALGYYNEESQIYEFSCGGTLISPSFVLTAAHCIIHPGKSRPKIVRLGTIFVPEYITSLDPQLDILVKKITTHPGFKRLPKLHDIAVIELQKSLDFSYKVQPSCLYVQNDDPDEMRVSGWGTIESGSRSEVLQTGYINSIPNKQCQKAYTKKYFLTIEPTHVCAGNDTINTCKGDSGGPLQVFRNGVPYLVGITAGGAKCGSRAPGIYTRVSSYLDWIESVVWP